MVDGVKELKNISSDEMARYLEQSFRNPAVQEFLNTSEDLQTMTGRFVSVGRYISVYATATGDLSQESVSKVTKDLKDHTALERDKRAYLKEVLGPMILKFHCQKLGISYPASIEETPKLLESVRTQSKNNRFETHSFNGALLEDIQKNGFDISKEKFQTEFKVLESVGMRQPYQKGNLLFCELSYGSFGYALRAPEKLMMSLGASSRDQQKTQSNRDFCFEALEKYIAQKGVSESDKSSVRQAGKKIIDFYFRPDGNKSAIAIKKSMPLTSTRSFEGQMWQSFAYYSVKSEINSFCRKNGDSKSVQLFDEAQQEFNRTKNHDKLKLFIREFNQKYPEGNPIQKAYQEFLFSSLRASCLNNYENANCDGYVIPGGRLAPKDFSLAVMDNPIDNYVEYQKQQAKPYSQKYGILFGSDGKNYMVPIGKDGKLIIPETLKERHQNPDTKPSNHDLLRGASNGGQGQSGEEPLDKHNGLDYRDIQGKNRKPIAPEPIRPEPPVDDEHRKKAEEIRRNLGWNNQMAVKRGHSL